MEKEFINYTEALALKELGFDEECFGFYDAYNGSSHLLLNDRYEPLWLIRTWQRLFSKKYQDTTFVSQSYVEYINGVCLAPTFSQAFRWFREKYGLISYIHPFALLEDKGIWCYEITDFSTNWDESSNLYSPEEAELECLKKLIEIIKAKS